MKTLIISDIHANLAALRSVLDAEPDSDQIVCLGDIVDYGPQPTECIELVRSVAQIVVQGNHDYAVGNAVDPQCSPAFKHLAQVTQEFTMSILSSNDIRFLAHLPIGATFKVEDAHIFAVHAAPSDPHFKYIPPDAGDNVWELEVVGWNPDILLIGHTHLPFVKTICETMIVNPGSVGQPKDGDPRASYAVLENCEVTLKRAEYDVDLTANALRATGLPHTDVDALAGILRRGGD